MCDETSTRRWLLIERTLAIIGIVCLSWTVVVTVRAWRYQSTRRAVATRMPVAGPPQRMAPPLPPTELAVGEPIGRLDVPRLRLSAVVANGDDDGTLRVAVGHLPDTPLPWENGNSALAGHRDTFFRALQGIRVGDDLRMVTAYGDFVYRVNRILIVTPDDLSVLAPTPEASLTLVTCYPFSYIGHAPKRFTVQAARVAQAPS